MIDIVTKEKLVNTYVWLTEFFLLALTFPLFASFLKLRVKGREHFSQVHKPFIIVSNHISFYDSFLFRFIFGFWTPHLPLRFMAVEKFDKKFMQYLSKMGIVRCVYITFGAFIVKPGEGIKKNLQQAEKIIHAGGNIVIFPEGKIVSSGKIESFYKGSAMLAQMTAVPVIPVSMRFGSKKRFGRRDLIVCVGEPIFNSDLSIDELTGLYYRVITEQYNEHYE